MDSIPSCEYLQLKPTPELRERIFQYIAKKQQPVPTIPHNVNIFDLLTGKMGEVQYEPYCTKIQGTCPYLLESAVNSLQHTGGMYQPLFMTLVKVVQEGGIESCSDRKPPKSSKDGMELLQLFLLMRIMPPMEQEFLNTA